MNLPTAKFYDFTFENEKNKKINVRWINWIVYGIHGMESIILDNSEKHKHFNIFTIFCSTNCVSVAATRTHRRRWQIDEGRIRPKLWMLVRWHVMMVNYGLALDRVSSLVSQMDLDFVHCRWFHSYRANAISLATVLCRSFSYAGCSYDCWCCCCDDWNSTYSLRRYRNVVSHIRSMWMLDGCDGSCSYQRYVSIVASDSADDVDCKLFVFVFYFLYFLVKNNVASCIY